MKCIFTTNDISDSTYPLLKAAINSLQKNTTLTPVVMMSIDTDIEHPNHEEGDKMIEWLHKKNVEIVYHTPTWYKDIKHFTFKTVTNWSNEFMKNMYLYYPNYYNMNFIKSESLRIDIPIVFPDEEYVMYVDCDVLFLKDPEIKPFEKPLAAALRGSFFNNGVMVFNIPLMKESYEDFLTFFLKSNYSFVIGETTSQGAYNTYYHDKVAKMPLKLNWHVFTGKDKDVTIAHFCGASPYDYIKIQKQLDEHPKKPEYEMMYASCLNGSVKYFIEEWNKYAEEKDKMKL